MKSNWVSVNDSASFSDTFAFSNLRSVGLLQLQYREITEPEQAFTNLIFWWMKGEWDLFFISLMASYLIKKLTCRRMLARSIPNSAVDWNRLLVIARVLSASKIVENYFHLLRAGSLWRTIITCPLFLNDCPSKFSPCLWIHGPFAKIMKNTKKLQDLEYSEVRLKIYCSIARTLLKFC